MKKSLLYIYLIILLLVLSVNPAIALRCGNDLIREGDTTINVRITLQNNGGEIIAKETLGGKTEGNISSQTQGYRTHRGYTSNTQSSYNSNTELVEKWFIKAPSGYGSPYCYELKFVGSILKEIGPGVQCK